MTIEQNGKTYWYDGTRDYEGTPIDLYRNESGAIFIDVRPVIHFFGDEDEIAALAPGHGPALVPIEYLLEPS